MLILLLWDVHVEGTNTGQHCQRFKNRGGHTDCYHLHIRKTLNCDRVHEVKHLYMNDSAAELYI